MERIILHSDLNNFYASVECLYHPHIRNKPVAVCGDVEKRHGIILAKNNIAKKSGVKTGETLWQAKGKCPDIVFVPPSFDRYIRYSKMAKEIYMEYSHRVEPFGLDECWIDVTESQEKLETAKELADHIRKRIGKELGVTASIGVSFNKVFAKLGSDYQKPDATTVISKQNFKNLVWPLPACDLLYVGPATTAKLKKHGVNTIGDLAQRDVRFLKSLLGVNGVMLSRFANGLDTSAVMKTEDSPVLKSIGNSTTMPFDVANEEDIKITIYVLSESVAARLRKQGLKCGLVQIGLRNHLLYSFERQGPLQFPSNCAQTIGEKAFSLCQKHRQMNMPLRSISIRACQLTDSRQRQISLLEEYAQMEKHEKAEAAIDDIRRRFGHFSIQRGIMLTNTQLSSLNPQKEHTIHPANFLK